MLQYFWRETGAVFGGGKMRRVVFFFFPFSFFRFLTFPLSRYKRKYCNQGIRVILLCVLPQEILLSTNIDRQGTIIWSNAFGTRYTKHLAVSQ